MDDRSALLLWGAVWLVTAVVFVLRHWRAEAGLGLVLTYVFSFGVMHWLAPVLYLLPWYRGVERALVVDGLRESTYAMLAFAGGAEVIALGLRRRGGVNATDRAEVAASIDPRIVTLFLVAGGVFYAAASRIVEQIPTVTALASAGSTLVIAGVGLKCWNAWLANRNARIWWWLAASASLPMVTVITQGFLGYGFVAMLTIGTLVVSFYRPRWVILGSLLGAYLGLSVYVTYMRDRDEIRSVVWGGAAFSDRAARLYETFAELEWFSLYDEQHLERIDDRLNQGFLVGAGMAYLEDRPAAFARGATILDAGLALVPRALWPDKPTLAGSGNLVSDVTGIQFSEGTSVGVGHVLESYANFGTPGVVGVFLLLGGLVVLVDRKAREHLERGDVHGFALWFLPGFSLLQVGGSFVEVTGTAGAALVVVMLLKHATPWLIGGSSHTIVASLEAELPFDWGGDAREESRSAPLSGGP